MPFFPQFSNLFVAPYIQPAAVTPIPPNDINGLELWLDAGSDVTLDGDIVTAWQDQSENGNDAIPVNDPLFVSSLINGNPAIEGISNGAYFDLTSNIPIIKTVVCVFKTNEIGSGYQAIVESDFGMYSSIDESKFGTYLNAEIGYASLSNNTAYILGIVSSDGINSSGYINQSSYSSSSGSGFANRGYVQIGAGQNGGQPSDGYIAEVVIYSVAISENNRLGLFSYLNNKYAIY